jgi:hypothetical protein
MSDPDDLSLRDKIMRRWPWLDAMRREDERRWPWLAMEDERRRAIEEFRQRRWPTIQ